MLDLAGREDIGDLEPNQVAAAQLAVDGKVEERQFTGPLGDVETDTDRPDMFRFERLFLADDATLVPSGAAGADGWQILSSHDGFSDPACPPRLRHPADGTS